MSIETDPRRAPGADPEDPAGASRAEVCIAAAADIFACAGEVVVSAFGIIPQIGLRLARATRAPELMYSDGNSSMVCGTSAIDAPSAGPTEAWVPFRSIFDLLWSGRRLAMMIPSQIDPYGNINISAIGDYERPKAQLIGVRGAPGNTVSHPTGYWVAAHSPRVFTERVDMVAGVGTDRARAAGPGASRFHALRPVLTNLAVLDYDEDGRLQIASVHPGSSVADVQEATGFALAGGAAPTTRYPTAEELHLIRDVLDPHALREREVGSQ